MNKRILLCDDDAGILELITTILRDEGYKLLAISNSKGIKKKIIEFIPDLILIDIWMPGMSGAEVSKMLKNDPETKDFCIILISALSDTEDRAKQAQADDYIIKPFDIADLVAVVKKNISKKT